MFAVDIAEIESLMQWKLPIASHEEFKKKPFCPSWATIEPWELLSGVHLILKYKHKASKTQLLNSPKALYAHILLYADS